MQIQQNYAHSQSFGLKCPIAVKEKLAACITSGGRAFFKNQDIAAQKAESLGSSSTKLSAVKFTRGFWNNGEFEGAKDICRFTFKMSMPEGKTETIRYEIEGVAHNKPDLFKALFKATKDAEREVIHRYLLKNASRGQLHSAVGQIEKMYPNRKGYIAHTAKQLEAVNGFAQNVQSQFEGFKEFFRKLLKK